MSMSIPTATKNVSVIVTYGSMMDLRVRFISGIGHNGMFFPHFDIPAKPVYEKDEIISEYKEFMRNSLGLDMWMPNPALRHITLPALPEDAPRQMKEIHEKREFFWVHTPQSNQHRVWYSETHLAHVVPLDIALSKISDVITQSAVRGLIRIVNQLRQE